MAADDYYTHLARQQIQRLDASRAQALADLEAAKASNDYESAGEAVQVLADLEAKKANVLALHGRYVDSQTPSAPVELTAEEKAAKPWDKMTWEDGLDLARTSKYGRDLDHSDPNVQVMARRQRGE